MIINDYTGIAHLLSRMADEITSEDLPNILNYVDQAKDEGLLVSACINKMTSYCNFADMTDGAEMLNIVNCAISDLNHSMNELSKLCVNLKSIQPSNQQPQQAISSTPVKPHTGVKKSTGGNTQ